MLWNCEHVGVVMAKSDADDNIVEQVYHYLSIQVVSVSIGRGEYERKPKDLLWRMESSTTFKEKQSTKLVL